MQSYHEFFENLVDKNLIFADIVYFDLIYPSEKKRENSNRVQKMFAKVCRKFLNSLPILVSFYNRSR